MFILNNFKSIVELLEFRKDGKNFSVLHFIAEIIKKLTLF